MRRRSIILGGREQSRGCWILGVEARAFTAALIATSLLTACGQTAPQHEVAPRVAPPTQTPHPPATYAFDDATCQQDAKPGAAAITKGQIYSWEGDNVVPHEVTFHDTTASVSLSSSAIHTTVAGAVFQRSCTGAAGSGFACADGPEADKGWAEVRGGTALRLCRDDAVYPRQAVETIGLTSIYFIQAARDRYLAVTAADAAPVPEPIALAVMPAFITDFSRTNKDGKEAVTRTYITDNLAYFPDARMIAVFPLLAEDKRRRPGFYWESGFVLGHEYGHHIDFARHGHVLSNVGLTWDPQVHGFSDQQALATGRSGSSARAQLAGAEAEGFADLLGYYVGNANGQTITGLPRIGHDRDPGDGKFANKEPKVLTTVRLKSLLGLAAMDTEPAFADIHQTGAVIAYTANQVFSQLTAATSSLETGSPEEIDGRYRLTLAFMDELVAQMAKLRPEDGAAQASLPLSLAFEQATTMALNRATIKPNVDALKTSVCQIVARQMPGLASAPFSTAGQCQ